MLAVSRLSARYAGGCAIEKLTATERAIALLVAEGVGNKQIARALHITDRTVANDLSTVYRVLDLPPGRNQRVLLALMVERARQGADKGG